MRTLVTAIVLAAIAVPATADTSWMLPAPGVYCPSNHEPVLPLVVGEDGGLGVDGLDCQPPVRLRYGLASARRCYANGGSEVPYETDLLVLPSGAMLHDSVVFRLWKGKLPCPAS